ncbi:hypothetical protein STCU_00335 [Strigomonas culicis]|uniref:Uncharacterized protein n=1 Tax=Strigomonas culicis TaxID=28005 RepID=S9U7P6_9TRYP|nr:hypothetical protein STCU_06976 [Strigomonas culicis]EPY36931.1 hypothetical protein STCU_00335 [Strigomonas culicis]|eukprot:EPY24844.1 hypothetical protein STCU_06976 [Strigomonas culicis]
MSFLAINICLVSTAFDSAVLPLSGSLCPAADDSSTWDSDVAYQLIHLSEKKPKKGYGHAHCTLVQLCARTTELNELKEEVRRVCAEHRPEQDGEKLSMERVCGGPIFGKLPDDTEIYLPYVRVERSEPLYNLHSALVNAVRRFAVAVKSTDVAKSSFHKHFPTDGTTSIDWMLKYIDEHSYSNYNPHITLGASPMCLEKLAFLQRTEVPWRRCRVVVSHMGNYCSCFEILDQSNHK